MQAVPQNLKPFRIVRVLAFSMLIGAPIVYPIVALVVQKTLEVKTCMEMIVYMLLLVGMLQPALFPMIKKTQVNTWRKNQPHGTDLAGLYQTLMITKFALVEAIYVYALVIFFVTGEISNMLYFYVVGIVWTVIHWPRQSRFEQVLREGPEAI